MNPRKSSTSSARPARPPRPRYLGIEVAGGQPIPPRILEQALRRMLTIALGAPAPMRVIRSNGPRSVVEVPHQVVPAARSAWNRPLSLASGNVRSLQTRRTWGTLRKAKRWVGTVGHRSSPRNAA